MCIGNEKQTKVTAGICGHIGSGNACCLISTRPFPKSMLLIGPENKITGFEAKFI